MHLAIDIETLGTSSRSVVLSLGAAFALPDHNFPAFYRSFCDENLDSIQYQIDALGRDVSASTIRWWMDQSEQAKKATFEAAPAHTAEIYEGITQFIDWIASWLDRTNTELRSLQVWGYGATFDNTILRSLMEDLRIECPWRFTNDKCLRTLKDIYPKVERPVPGIAHCALDDAIAQAKYLAHLLEVNHAHNVFM